MTGIAERPARGFTLVEVLVALMVMAVMAMMAWQGVDGIVRTRNASQARLEQTLRFNTVIAQWDQDLLSVQAQASTTVPQAVSCDGTSVRIVRRTPDGLQVVVWSLRPDDQGHTWVRWAAPPVATVGGLTDAWLRSLQLQGNETGSLKTIGGLASWRVYFYRGNAWSNCQSSAGTVAGGGNAGSPLPDGVRIVLEFQEGSGVGGELTRDTLMRP